MACNFTIPVPCNADPLGPSLTDVCPGSEFFVFLSLLNSLVRANEKISGICERVRPVERPDNQYDFIVVGGGAAGCAVAARLSEILDWKILLIEAGFDEPAGTQIPNYNTLYLRTNITWPYRTINEEFACLSTNGSCDWTSAKTLGGNTVFNVMLYLRGNKRDYDIWGELGNEGWSWDEVLPYFKKGEDNGDIERVGRRYHGTGGPLSVQRFRYTPDLSLSFLAAADQIGYGVTRDFNGDQITGYANMQGMQKDGVRHSAARSYLWPIRNRRNLDISLGTLATRVIIENGRAIGVEYIKDGVQGTVFATREVILSASVVESPKLLLLSGIGPREELESMDIEVVRDVPGVGKNLQDHLSPGIVYTWDAPDTYDNDWDIAEEYLATQTGPLSGIGTQSVVAILASNLTTDDYPDIENYMYAYYSVCATGQVGGLASEGGRTLVLQPSYLHPKSRGTVTLASKDPMVLPIIHANYLSEPEDMVGTVEAMKKSVAMLFTPALSRYNFTLSDPTLEVCADLGIYSEDWYICAAQQTNYQTYHQVGTCKMGPASDPMAVVDPRLRVYGIAGLRVVDISIMPVVISGNTAAPGMMIGERAADFIKEDWGRRTADENTCPYSKY